MKPDTKPKRGFGKKMKSGPAGRTGSPSFREAFQQDRKPARPLLERERTAAGRHPFGWGAAFLWTAFVSVSSFTLFFSDFHTVRTVAVSGTRDIPVERIDAFVRERLAEKRFGFVPSDTFFLVPAESICRELSRAFPKLRQVVVSKRFPDTVTIEVTERDRMLLWCSGDPCFLVDDDGNARDAAPTLLPENDPFVVRVIDESARPVDIDAKLLSGSVAESILALEADLRESGIVGITLPFHSPSRVSDEVRITTEEGWDLLVSLGIDPEKTIASLRLVLGKEILADRRSALRYIDLRTENKAFFAYTDWTPPEDETTDPATSAGVDKKTDDKKD